MGVTIKDVAKYAGVSPGTVSRAFHGYQDISEETRQRIFEAVRELGYAPNVNARSLSSKSAPNIGMIVSGLLESSGKDNTVYMLLQGVYKYAFENGMEVALYTTDSANQNRKPYVRFCMEHSLYGAILSGIKTNDSYFEELIDSKIPCVLIDVNLQGQQLGHVSTDNVEAARVQTQYLFDANHQKIVVISGRKNAAVTMERIAGIYHAFQENDRELSRDNILYCEFSEETAYEKTKEFLRTRGSDSVTAFLCMSDLMALGVMKALKEEGLKIPDDISVIGFDGLPIVEYTTPAITTIQQDFVEMGYQAAALLQNKMEGKETPSGIYVPFQFVERDSVRKL